MSTDTPTTTGPLLEVTDLAVFYGPIQAVHGVSFSVSQGSIVALLGANGAGKTTILRTVSGFLEGRAGTVRLEDRVLGRTGPETRVARGVALVADNRLLFPTLTVDENLRAGGYRLGRHDLEAQKEAVYAHFPGLADRRKQPAGSLSGGQAQMLAIGRALMTKPKLLLLDEPSQGLAPKIVMELFELIRRLANEFAMTVLLVEQNATMALDLAAYGYVLSNGRIELKGETATLKQERSIERLYLGG